MVFSPLSVFSYGSISPSSVVETRVLTCEELDATVADSPKDVRDDTLPVTVTATPVKTLGNLQLAVIVFYTVSGGPFGMEETIRASGAFYALVGFALFPLIWSVPEALVTAELGSAYPEASGTVAWVEEAFGPFWGWLQGCLTWVSGVTDNAIYPVLFLDYAFQFFATTMMMTWIRSFDLPFSPPPAFCSPTLTTVAWILLVTCHSLFSSYP